MSNNRRDFLKKTTMLGLAGLAGNLVSEEKLQVLESFTTNENEKFTLPNLPYAYNALEPFIDAQTMEIHHSKHHQGYVNKLNKALEGHVGSMQLPVLFSQISKLDTAIRNNGGGHYNHSLFWELMQPNPENKKLIPEGKIAEAIISNFQSIENFQSQFSEKAAKLFGSGWCWLIEQNGKLKITTTPNQDNPLMDVSDEKGKPILALDVWEHAYYLKHQNKRADYINNWWNVVNWKKVNELYISK